MPSILDSLGSGVLDAPKPKPVEFRTIDDPVSTRRLLYNNVLDGVRNMAPISNQVFTLKLKDADYADPEEFTLKQQKEALLGGKTLSRRLRGTFQLIDNKDNKIVDEKKITIAEVPHLTDRGVFVLNGSDWSLASQLRLLPGVFTRVKGDGTAESHCFHKAVKVHTEIGLIPIGRLVNERMRVRVWSYDLIEKKFVLKRITNWFQNRITGPTRRERLGRLVFDSLATTPTLLPAHKATRIWATPTHKAIRADGSKEEFRTARTVLQVEEKPSAWQEQIILGSILGDGNITASGILNEAHGLEQSDYLRFKAEILGQLLSQPLYERCVYENDGRVRRSIWLHTKAWSYLKRLHGAVYRRRGGKNIPHSLLSRLDPRGLAVFFCDDGCHLRTENSTHITTHLELSFAMHDFSTKSVERFRKHLLDKYGLESKQTRARRYLGTDVGWYTLLSGDHAEKFMDLLAPYIPTCMRYKLGERPPTGQCTGCGKEVDRRRKRCNKCCLEHYTQDRENSTAAKRFGGRTVVDAILESGVVPPESNLGETWDARLASLGAGISLCEEDRRTVLGTLEIPCKFDPYLNRPAKDKNDRYAYDIEVEGTHNYLANGILVSNCNIMPGKGISSRINLDPAKNIFKLSIGQSEIPLMPLLKAMGVPDKKLQEDWGMKIWSDNAKYDDDKTLDKLYKKVLGYRAAGDANIQQKRTELAAAMRAMPVDPEVTKITLGQPYTHLDSDTILTAAKKVLQVSRGEAEVDDRDNMSYQTVMGPEDLFGERARVLDRVLRPLLWKATFRRNLSPLTSGVGTRSVAGAITDSGLGQSIEESSPLDVYDQMTRVTRLGRGGIEDKDSIPSESRSVQPSHFGYIDPIRTPEALSAGVDLRFASGSMKGSDGKLYAKFTDARTGEQKLLNPQQVQKLAIAFPGEMKSSSKYARALRDGKIQYVRKDQVDLLAPPMEDAFNGLANLIAGKSATKPQRMMMGSRMYTQALPLEKPESPWVQSGKPGAEDRSYEDDFAEKVGARFSKDAGRVVAVDDDEIQVKTADGKIVKHELYNNFPLNRRTLIRSTPVVSVGQEVQPGMMLAKSNYTDDRGSLAVGTNLKVGYIAEGFGHEDAAVLSESGARKLTSEHLFQNTLDLDDKLRMGKRSYISLYPASYDRKTLEAMDDDGVIKPGEVVQYGQPLILAAKEKERAHNQITRGKDSSFSDHSVTWEHHDPGVVTDVVKTDKGINVSVRGYMPFQVGDKIAGRLGDKSVISKIIPDEQMPRGEDGKPLDLIVNPLGVVTRTNPSQVTEAVLGKIAALRGTPYKLKDFDDISDLNQYAIDEAKKHGVKAMETLTDPMTGRKIPDILVGQRFIMKLHHMSEHKSQGRSIGGYTQNDEPAKGGGDGDSSKRMALMDLNALLSHGALTMARNNHLLRGTKRLDWWAATMAGLNPPEPEIPFINQKYFESLKAAGINPLNQSGRLRFMALTDKDVDTLAENRNLQNSDTVDWDNGLKPNPGGLFDPGMTGSHGGRRWSAIPLHEPMINPVMEDPVRKVLGLTTKRFDAILEGKEQLNGLSGPIALQRALEDVNLDTEIARARGEIASGKKTKRSDAIKRLQLLRRTQELKMHPKDWVLKRVPVLPPAFRPVSIMQGNKMPMIADANALYRDLFEANQNLKQMSQISDDTSNERRAVYEAFRAVVGLGDPITPKNQERKVKGILRQVLGSNPKHSMLQRKLLGSAVDMVGRAVIIPDPTLDIDEAGIPENKAWEIYRPFIIRRLVRHGMTPIMAADRVKDRDPLARKMMLTEMEARPIVATRAPVLHRYGVMGFWPRLVKHNALSLPPSTWKGLGADADGNCCDYDTELNLIFNKTALQSDPEFLQALETTVMRLCGNQLVDLYDGDGQAYLTLKIGDFPRVGEPRIDKNGASIYRVPKGVSVLTVETGRGSFFSPVTSLTVEENCRTVEVRTDSGHSVIVSDNESLAVFNETTLRFDKCKPEESINKWLPIAKSAGKFGNQFSRDLGWWYGAFVSDGWVSERYTGYAKEDPRMRQEFLRILRAEICDNFSYNEYEEKPEKGKNKHGHSVKMHLWSPVLQSRIFNCYGLPRSEWGEARGSLFKKIPDEILQHGSEECLLGLLAGLLEGDGSLYWNNTKGMNRRPNTRVSTSSSYLITTLKKLLHRFGVAWSVTETPPREGANTHVAYNLTMSVPDVVALLPRLKFLLPETRKIAKEFTQHGITKPDEDYMPAPTAMLAVFKKVTLRAKTREGNTLYSAISKFGKRGEITRYSALRLLNEFLPAARAMAPELPWEGYQKLYNDRDILWTRVKSSTESGQRQVFDLAIPETKVFAVNDGLVIYDTMNYHVPVTDEEVQEVIDKMLPSKNLFSTKTFKVHQLPQNEYAGGLYVGSTKVDKESPEEVFQNAADAMRAFKEGRIGADRRVVIINQ